MSRSKTASPKRRRGGAKASSQASSADRHVLYERAVQDPKNDARTLAKLFRRYRERSPELLREDFCGTATLAAHWVSSKPERKAVGVDLDGPTLAWGQIHNLDAAGPDVASRVQLFEANVLDGKGPPADITCALNFSYCCLKDRATLLRYFRTVRDNLSPDGVFVADVLGGPDAMRAAEERNDLGDFVYRWEQSFFDPLTHEMECHIHFEFPDGSELSPAFSYEWRLWTMPELCDALVEAGFSAVHRLWEKTDKKGEGTGAFFEPERVDNWDQWWTYLVAER